MQKTLYIGLDVHKASVSVSVAEDGRDGAVRFVGDIPNTPTDVAKLAKRLAKDGRKLEFCYEAGCCGYGLYRQLNDMGHGCMVVAPSRIPRMAGDRIKNDRRDAQRLAVLHRSGDLTAVWVPDAVHEAMRDLSHARVNAALQLMRSRHHLLSFLLRHGRKYPSSGQHWTRMHGRWLATQSFEQPAHQIVFQDYMEAILAAQERRDGLARRITGNGNQEARRMLIEAAWSYRYPARVAKRKAEIVVKLPKVVRDTAWKAQARLCAKYRRLVARGKKPTVATAAIARELSGFIWAIGQEVKPAVA